MMGINASMMDTSVDDDPRCGCPSSTNKANVKHVQEIVRNDRRKSVDQTESEVGISVGSCHSKLILQCVEHKLAACGNIWYLKMLTSEQYET